MMMQTQSQGGKTISAIRQEGIRKEIITKLERRRGEKEERDEGGVEGESERYKEETRGEKEKMAPAAASKGKLVRVTEREGERA